MDQAPPGGFDYPEQCCLKRQIDLEDPGVPEKEEEMHASSLEQDIRAALMKHWAASDANDFSTEHERAADAAPNGELCGFVR
jgi:hypothetical protein